MQDYDEIRRRFLAGESQRHIAKTMGISRNTVKKYCEGNAVPWERKTPDRESTILTPDVVRFIQNCLDEDSRQGLKKLKKFHTAKSPHPPGTPFYLTFTLQLSVVYFE